MVDKHELDGATKGSSPSKNGPISPSKVTSVLIKAIFARFGVTTAWRRNDHMRIFLGSALTVVLMTACNGSDDQQETGFKDGYAFGYSRDCENTLANVDTDMFEDPDYASGFARGRREGQAVCSLQRATFPRSQGAP